MGDEVQFDVTTFTDACTRIYSKWEAHAGEEAWGTNADALVIVAGSTDEDVIQFPKSLALHACLFGIELNDVLLVFCEKKIVILAASKKAKISQTLADKLPESFGKELQVLTRDKTDKDAANYAKVLEIVKESKSGKRVGTLSKEKNYGDFAKKWDEALKESGLEVADVQNGIADFLAVKSAGQLEAAKKGAALNSETFKKKLQAKILDIVDQEDKKFMMSKLSDDIEEKIGKMAKDQGLKEEDVEVVLPPVIQSGGVYDLKYTAQTKDKEALHLPDTGVPAIHICSISIRHKLVTCTLARTLLFNAKKEQADNYKILHGAFEECVNAIKPGVRLNKVYETCAAYLKDKKPELLEHLQKELGWGLGYEIREKRLVLDEKNKHTFHAGMIFCLRLGVDKLELKHIKGPSHNYALLIADTLIVTEDGAEVITTVGKKHSKVSWNVSDEPEEEEKKTDKKNKASEQEIKKALLDKYGNEKTRKTEAEEAEQRKMFEERNRKLAQERVAEQRRRVNKDLTEGGGSASARSQVSGYNGPEDFPHKASGLQLCVDDSSSTLLVPINGVPTPFHVSTIKNMGIQQQGLAGTVLRINFLSPGAGINIGMSNKHLVYLRELSFRAQDSHNLTMVHKQISDMKKAFSAAEREKKARDELVPQEALRLNPNRGPRLQTLKIYPNIQARGKKTEGDLEAHVNGFRFTVKKAPSPDLRHVDILYRNIKHAFYQPSHRASTLILIHFRLKNPIMVGKNSTKDIQFFVEWMDDGESLLENKRKNAYDRDEIEDENRQKQMVQKLDGEFKRFCDRTQELIPPMDPSEPDGDKVWEWDIPYSELEFQGNPKSSMVELYPSVNCIVHLATKPVCIIELDSVDLAYYERVRAGNTNFDITFVHKQFLDPDAKIADCWQRISSIDMKYYDTVKDVLQKSKLVQFEGTMQVNWNNVLKDYIKNFDDISKDGGWEVIFGGDDSENDDDEEDEEDDEFHVSSGSGSSGSEEEDSEEDYSSIPEDSDEYSEESLSDEGLDSDEAEAWAAEEDDRTARERKEKELKQGVKRGRDDSDDERGGSSKKKKSKGGAPSPKKSSSKHSSSSSKDKKKHR